MRLKKHLLLLSTLVSISISSCGGLGSFFNDTQNENSTGSTKSETTTEEVKKDTETKEDTTKEDNKTEEPKNEPKEDPKPNPEPEVTTKYKTTFYFDDNKTVYKTLELPVGTVPTLEQVGTPTKPDDYENKTRFSFSYWQVITTGQYYGKLVGDLEKNNGISNIQSNFFNVDFDIAYKAVFDQRSLKFNVKFYNDDELITSFDMPYDSDYKNETYINAVSRGLYREPIKIDNDGNLFGFNGWSTTKGASSGYSRVDLPLLKDDTVYYATFSKTSTKVFTYEWNFDSNGKMTREITRDVQYLLDQGSLQLNGTTITSFIGPKKKVNDFNWGYNLYLTDNRFTKIGAQNGDTPGGLAGCEATNLYMNSITEIGARGLSLSRIKTLEANNVTTIGEGAFYKNDYLTSITLPKLGVLSTNAFDQCVLLENVTFGSLTQIGQTAFRGCTSLKSITIPNSVTTISRDSDDYMPFTGCSSLETISIGSTNSKFRVENNALISKSDNALLVATNNTTSVPTSVKVIMPRAFDSLKGLTEVTIPTSVTSISSKAFSACSNLTKVIYKGTYNEFKNKCPSSAPSNIFTFRNANTISITCSDKTVQV